MLALLVAAITGTLYFTLPSHEAGDSCGVAQATCSDLDSVFLWRQDAAIFHQPTIIKRATARGMEGSPWSFSYQCDGTCQYYVTTKDTHGNESCPSAIYQAGGTTSVPQVRPRAWRPGRWDVMGRKMEPRASGIYFSPDSARKIVTR